MGETFDSDGVPIHYTDQGPGEPIVLLHGLTQILNGWHRSGTVAELSARYRVITLDLRGHGMSGKPHSPKDHWADSEEEFARFTEEGGRRGERFPWEPKNQDFAAIVAAVLGRGTLKYQMRRLLASRFQRSSFLGVKNWNTCR